MLKIMIISNELDTVAKLSTFIVTKGHQVLTALSEVRSLDLIAEHRPHIVVLSSEINHSTPQDFIIKASQKKVFTNTNFVLMTNSIISGDDKMRFMSLGFSAFFSSEINFDDQSKLDNLIIDEIKFHKLVA
jgi:two-component SAPR family response regulator